MTITLELPQELEHELASEAARLHLPLAEYILRLLRDQAAAAPDVAAGGDEDLIAAWMQARAALAANPPRTGAEILAYWQREGLLGARPDITDTLAHARALRRRAARRERG